MQGTLSQSTVIIRSILLLIVAFAGFAINPDFGIVVLSISFILYSVSLILPSVFCATGGFVFGFTLFFAGRPLYIVAHEYLPATNRFNTIFDSHILYNSLFLAVASFLFFVLGTISLPALSLRYRQNLLCASLPITSSRPSQYLVLLASFLSFISCIIIYIFASLGKGALYSSSVGAYAYQLPVLLQGFCLASVVLSFERLAFHSRYTEMLLFILSASMLVFSTITMRDISIFRAFYLSGLLSAFCSIYYIIQARRLCLPKLKYLALFTLILLPAFRFLGSHRFLDNSSVLDIINSGGTDLVHAYFSFFNESGDLNIFDTFVAALQYKPAFHPYIYSWLYAFFHFVPRFIWHSKPLAGITQDLSFLNGAPYSPGINGFFYLDGGIAWMFISMFILGLVLARLDVYVSSIRQISARAVLTSVITIYSIFLPRYLLWQFIYGIIALVIPFVLFSVFRISPNNRLRGRSFPS